MELDVSPLPPKIATRSATGVTCRTSLAFAGFGDYALVVAADGAAEDEEAEN